MISQNQPHDLVVANTGLKRWVGARKGADAMTVNQKLDFAWRTENGGNLGKATSKTHLLFSKSAGVAPPPLLRLRDILRVYL